LFDVMGGDARTQAAAEGGLAGRVLSQAGLDYVAHMASSTEPGSDGCAADGFADSFSAEFDGRERGESSQKFSNGRADGAQDYRLIHLETPSRRGPSWPRVF